MGSNQSSLAKEIKKATVPTMEHMPCSGARGQKAERKESPIVETESVIDSEEEEDEEDDEEWKERLQILEDINRFKQLAEMFLHPEMPVKVDPAACGRCYFNRPSAPVQQTVEEAEEAAKVMQDMTNLKTAAFHFLHPEAPVRTTDPCACGRNYFMRPSAPDQESLDDQEEQEHVLEEAHMLEEWAVDYLHPELPVITKDPLLCCTNYFDRPSAPIVSDPGEAERILEEAKELKHAAVDYMHPELPIVTEDPLLCCTNYFDRPSAPIVTDADETERVLEEAKQLKHTAIDYMHPELPIVTEDPLLCCTNYFDRPSAPIVTDADETERVLEEAKQLKHCVEDYMHPEKHVETEDPLLVCTNYFDRPSAPEPTNADEELEAERILEEAKQLKHFAEDYMHPEKHVETEDPLLCCTNYFDRPSAVGHEEMIDSRGHDDMKLAIEYVDTHHQQFEMDEEISNDAPVVPNNNCNMDQHDDEQSANAGDQNGKQEGKLSRSPSSTIMECY